jgi:hypothetical protein
MGSHLVKIILFFKDNTYCLDDKDCPTKIRMIVCVMALLTMEHANIWL